MLPAHCYSGNVIALPEVILGSNNIHKSEIEILTEYDENSLSKIAKFAYTLLYYNHLALDMRTRFAGP